jgi:hypothetical protein
MSVFFEKPPVTSSNCYETMNNASILMKVGTNADWTNSMLNFKLAVTMETGDVSKLPKIMHCFFFHQN